MNDIGIHGLANRLDLRTRLEVRLADNAQYIIGGGGNPALKPKAELALQNPTGEVARFIWTVALNPDVQKHYDGTLPLAEGDTNTAGTLTYLLNYIVGTRIGALWA